MAFQSVDHPDLSVNESNVVQQYLVKKVDKSSLQEELRMLRRQRSSLNEKIGRRTRKLNDMKAPLAVSKRNAYTVLKRHHLSFRTYLAEEKSEDGGGSEADDGSNGSGYGSSSDSQQQQHALVPLPAQQQQHALVPLPAPKPPTQYHVVAHRQNVQIVNVFSNASSSSSSRPADCRIVQEKF